MKPLSLILVVALAGCPSSGGRTQPDAAVMDLARAGDFASKPLPVFDLSGLPDLNLIYAHTKDTLFTVDPTSFALTRVGSFGVSGTAADVDMTDLAVTPTGELYTISRTSIYSVNRATAKATKLQLDPLTSSNVALTCLIDGTILAADADGNLREIDIANNRVISRGSYGGGFNTAGDLVVILDGTVFGISATGPGSTTTSNLLITVDVGNNGRATGVGNIGFDAVFGVAYNNGRVIAFTRDGDIITIDPATGTGTLVKSTGEEFYGAGSSPLVPPVG